MRLLIYGAGVLGGNLAHYLKKQHEVTLLVRKTLSKKYENEGVKIKHKFKRKMLVDCYPIITELKEDDIYDAILIPVRFSQLKESINDIQKNRSKRVIFIGNNLESEKIVFKNKTVLFGFFHAAGYRHDGYIDSICMKKITIGPSNGNSERDTDIHKIFDGTGIKIIVENHMDAWLKTHGASILPLVFACYSVDGDLKKLSKDRDYSYQLIQAVKEAYDVLKALGYEILPKGEYETTVNRQKYCAWLYRMIFATWIGQISVSDHAMHAQDEMAQLLLSFLRLKEKANIETPTFDALQKQACMKWETRA